MKHSFFELASDLMAIGPAGSPTWTSVNPALLARLGFPAGSISPSDLDPHHLIDCDGSLVPIDWSIHEVDGLSCWVGRERRPNLARELQHRLKNHLQFVLSLLAFQSSRSTDSEARAELSTAESRTRAVARLHEAVHASADFSEVEFGSYLRQLVHYLASGEAASVSTEAVEVALRMEQAVPLAVIAHELVSTALEDPTESAITVRLQYVPDGKLSLRVVANGPAIPSAIPASRLELVEIFVEQLHGSHAVQDADGLDVSVTFPLQEQKTYNSP